MAIFAQPLSYAALHMDENTSYASTGGAMNHNQSALIRSVIEKMGQRAALVIATDNGAGGRELAAQLATIAGERARVDLQIVYDLLRGGEGSDWNAVLRGAYTER